MPTKKTKFIKYAHENMKRAFYTALGIVGDHDLAADLAQEAFIKAYSSFDSFDDSKKFFTWYYKILRNLSLNRIRDEKRRGFLSLNDSESDFSTSETDLESRRKKKILKRHLCNWTPESVKF